MQNGQRQLSSSAYSTSFPPLVTSYKGITAKDPMLNILSHESKQHDADFAFATCYLLGYWHGKKMIADSLLHLSIPHPPSHNHLARKGTFFEQGGS
jgi:hypothetical protein